MTPALRHELANFLLGTVPYLRVATIAWLTDDQIERMATANGWTPRSDAVGGMNILAQDVLRICNLAKLGTTRNGAKIRLLAEQVVELTSPRGG